MITVLIGATVAYDRSRRDVIAPGVRVANVDVGGLHAADAETRLHGQLLRRLKRPIVLRRGHRRFVIVAHDAGARVDAAALAAAAVRRSRRGWLVPRVVRALAGRRVDANLPVHIAWTRPAMRRLLRRVRSALDRHAVDARVVPSAHGLRKLHAHPGRVVRAGMLAHELKAALTRPDPPHALAVPTRRTAPRTTLADLARRDRAYIIIDRAAFRLRLYIHLRLARTYPIAVGRQGLETPAGLYDVQWKEVNPPWRVPNSPWAGALAGRTIPPGPQDPIKARWLAFNGGDGIHGTDDVGSIGSAASHGCIRMLIPDVINLYDRVPVGAPVYVA